MSRFERDTAARALGDGRFAVAFDPTWHVARGPNGGYVAAVIARAILAAAGDGGRRALRSLTVHYLAAPAEDDAEVTVRVERAGRGMTFASARCAQGDRTVALALGALAGDYPGALEYADARMPDVPAPEAIEPPAAWERNAPPFAQRFEYRPALGPPPFSGADRALAGGWMRFREPQELDAAALIALCDAWLPAPYARADRVLAAPTVDLTVHLRAPLPRSHDDVLVEVRSDTARDGLFEEDARIFARDGTLLAQSRQLALILEPDVLARGGEPA